MRIGKICKTLGYGGMLCSALAFANPCRGDNQFIFDEMTVLNNTVTISNNPQSDTEGYDIFKMEHPVETELIFSELSGDRHQMRACITLNSSAEKGAAKLLIKGNDVVLNSKAIRDRVEEDVCFETNIGISAIGKGNVIEFNSAVPNIHYFSAYQAADKFACDGIEAVFEKAIIDAVENEISADGNNNEAFRDALADQYPLANTDKAKGRALAHEIVNSDGFRELQNKLANVAIDNAMDVNAETFAEAIRTAVKDIDIGDLIDSFGHAELLATAGFDSATGHQTIGDVVADDPDIKDALESASEIMAAAAQVAFDGSHGRHGRSILPLVDMPVTDYSNCYAVKGNKSTALKIGKLVEESTLNGKVEVGMIEINASGEKLRLTNNAMHDSEGVLGTNGITVDLLYETPRVYENSDNSYYTTFMPQEESEPKLEVAKLKPYDEMLVFMKSPMAAARYPSNKGEIAVKIRHLARLPVGTTIPLVKCEECEATLVAKQTFLTQYDIDYVQEGGYGEGGYYVARVVKSRSLEEAMRDLSRNSGLGQKLDGWLRTNARLWLLDEFYYANDDTFAALVNWYTRADHMEKARITSSMMSAYNEVMLGRRAEHNFNQEHKLISWVSGFGDWFRQDEIQDLGARANTYGVIAGADYQLNSKWLFSLSFGYANSDVHLNGNNRCHSATGHQDSFVSSTAMTYKNKLGQGELSATGLFTSAFTRHKYNYSNIIMLDNGDVATPTTAYQKYDGFAFALGLDADWMLNYKDTAVKYGPIAQVGFDRTSQDGHSMYAPASRTIYMHEANVNNLWSILGAKAEYDCTLQQKKVNMYCQAGWKFQYLRNGANVDCNSSTATGSEPFTATGTYVDKSMLALKLGVSLFATESLNFGIEYGLDWNSEVYSNRANVEMAYMF